MLMVADHRYYQLEHIRQYLSQSAFPIQWVVDVPFRLYDQGKQYLITHHRLVQENDYLRQQQFLLEGKLQRLLALETENSQLRTLLKASPREGETLRVAEILKVDSDPFTHRIVINKGEEEGVYVGQPIIDAEGIMGEVIEVNPFTSRAILLTDASHAVPVESLRNGVRGIALGTGATDSLQLQHVPITTDLKAGDVLVTSGLGGRFPSGYPVGVITEVTQDTGESFASVKIKPSALLNRGRQVLLIYKNSDKHLDKQANKHSDKHSEKQSDKNLDKHNGQI